MDKRQYRLTLAMYAAGYAYDGLESTDEWVRFYTPTCGTIAFDGWDDLEDWLNGVVFDDPEVAKKVWDIMHEEVSA